MGDIKSVVANNISELRQSNGMTQIELGEKLNYSDKAVSKWEHADSMPDIAVLVEIANLFDVSLDYLIKEHNVTEETDEQKKVLDFNRGIITGLSILTVWFVVVLAFVLLSLIWNKMEYKWLCFVYAGPVSCIVWLVLNSKWFHTKRNFLIVSLLMWSTLVSVHLSLFLIGINAWQIYLLGIPGQIIILLWSFIKKNPKK